MAIDHRRSIPFDVISLVFEFLDRGSLLPCTLVSHTVHEAAKPHLFRTIILKHINKEVPVSTGYKNSFINTKLFDF